jgi:hypothetical protein
MRPTILAKDAAGNQSAGLRGARGISLPRGICYHKPVWESKEFKAFADEKGREAHR